MGADSNFTLGGCPGLFKRDAGSEIANMPITVSLLYK